MPGRIEAPTESIQGLRLAADVVISKRKSIFALVNQEHTIVYSSDTLGEIMEWLNDRDINQIVLDCSGEMYQLSYTLLPDPREAPHG